MSTRATSRRTWLLWDSKQVLAEFYRRPCKLKELVELIWSSLLSEAAEEMKIASKKVECAMTSPINLLATMMRSSTEEIAAARLVIDEIVTTRAIAVIEAPIEIETATIAVVIQVSTQEAAARADTAGLIALAALMTRTVTMIGTATEVIATSQS